MNIIEKQHLPSYITNYKNDARWLTKESENYIFHYFQDSVAEREIDNIINIQEESFDKIIRVLGVEKPTDKILYYIYPNKDIKRELMGDGGFAQAIFSDYSIHILYTNEDKPIGEHEDTHLLSSPLGLATGFFAEGLAEYLSWGRIVLNKTKDEWLEEGKGKILPIEKIVPHEDWMKTPDENFMYYYSFAGFFVGKMIERSGIDNFKDFYRSINRKMNYQEINDIFRKYCKVNLNLYI